MTSNRQSKPLIAVGEAYREMAEAVWAAGEAVGGILKGLVDAAIIAGIADAAGAATIETDVGPIVGYVVAETDREFPGIGGRGGDVIRTGRDVRLRRGLQIPGCGGVAATARHVDGEARTEQSETDDAER